MGARIPPTVVREATEASEKWLVGVGKKLTTGGEKLFEKLVAQGKPWREALEETVSNPKMITDRPGPIPTVRMKTPEKAPTEEEVRGLLEKFREKGPPPSTLGGERIETGRFPSQDFYMLTPPEKALVPVGEAQTALVPARPAPIRLRGEDRLALEAAPPSPVRFRGEVPRGGDAVSPLLGELPEGDWRAARKFFLGGALAAGAAGTAASLDQEAGEAGAPPPGETAEEARVPLPSTREVESKTADGEKKPAAPAARSRVGVSSAESERLAREKAALEAGPGSEEARKKREEDYLAALETTKVSPVAVDQKKWERKVEEAKALYQRSRNTTEWAQLAEKFGHIMAQYAAARHGLKHGVDLSGVKFDKTDWEAKLDRNLKEYASDLQNIERGQRGEERAATAQTAAAEKIAGTRRQALTKQYERTESDIQRDIDKKEAALERARSREEQNKLRADIVNLQAEQAAAARAAREEAKKEAAAALLTPDEQGQVRATRDAEGALVDLQANPDDEKAQKKLRILWGKTGLPASVLEDSLEEGDAAAFQYLQKTLAGKRQAVSSKQAAPAAPAPTAFPRTVRKGGQETTVENIQELREAQAEGWE